MNQTQLIHIKITYRLFAGNRNDQNYQVNILKTKFPGGHLLHFGPVGIFNSKRPNF